MLSLKLTEDRSECISRFMQIHKFLLAKYDELLVTRGRLP